MTTGHRYELHRTNTHETDEQGRRYRWCVYDYFHVNGQSGLSFWYFATKQEARAKYPQYSDVERTIVYDGRTWRKP